MGADDSKPITKNHADLPEGHGNAAGDYSEPPKPIIFVNLRATAFLSVFTDSD
jgi:hypothetical protein